MQIETHIFYLGTRMKNICKNICLSFSFLIPGIYSSEQTTIEPYNHDRDSIAVQHILDATPHYLRYEYLGFPTGTTEQYLESTNYYTDVLRVNNETVGFVNYHMEHFSLLTFYIHSAGVIHLIGVDSAHQRKGYGKQLMSHAIEKMKQNYIPSVSLAAKKSNNTAQKLYESCGLKIVVSLGDDFYYNKTLDVPTDKLPQGNSIQRHKKTSAAIATLAISGLTLWKYFL